MKVSPREKIMLSVLGILLLAYAYYNYIFLDQMSNLQMLREDRDAKIERKIMLEQKIKDGETLDQDYINSKNQIIRLSNHFFSEVEQEEFIVLLNDLADESKLKVQKIQFAEEDSTVAIQSFEEGRVKIDKYTDLIQRDKIKGYVNPENNGSAPASENQEPDSIKVDATQKESPSTDEKARGEVSYADENKEGETKVESDSNKTPDEVIQSDDPEALTYANNIRSLRANVEVLGTYEQIHQLTSLIAMNERNIIVDSIEIENTEEGIYGNLSLVFYKIVELEKYFETKDTVLVKNVVVKSSKSSPFAAYAWNFVPVSSGEASNAFGNTIPLPSIQPPQSIISPYIVYPDQQQVISITPAQEVQENYGKDNFYFNSNYSMERVFNGGYVQREKPETATPVPEPVKSNFFEFNTLTGVLLQKNANGTKNTGNLLVSDASGIPRKVLKLEYHLGEVGYYGSIRINLEQKNIVMNRKANDLLLKVKSDMLSGHNLGIEILDADNMVHNIVLYEDIDWTDWKDVRVLNMPRMSYPAKVQSIYVSRIEDSKITDSVIYIDALSFNYKQ